MVYISRFRQETDNIPATQQSIKEIQAQVMILVAAVTNLIKQRAAPATCHGREEQDDINKKFDDDEYNNDDDLFLMEEDNKNFFTSHGPIYDTYETDNDDDADFDEEECTSKDLCRYWIGDPIYDESDDENIELSQAEFATIILGSTFKTKEKEDLQSDLEKQSINYALWEKDESVVLPCYGTVKILDYEQVGFYFSRHCRQRKSKPPDPTQRKSLSLCTDSNHYTDHFFVERVEINNEPLDRGCSKNKYCCSKDPFSAEICFGMVSNNYVDVDGVKHQSCDSEIYMAHYGDLIFVSYDEEVEPPDRGLSSIRCLGFHQGRDKDKCDEPPALDRIRNHFPRPLGDIYKEMVFGSGCEKYRCYGSYDIGGQRLIDVIPYLQANLFLSLWRLAKIDLNRSLKASKIKELSMLTSKSYVADGALGNEDLINHLSSDHSLFGYTSFVQSSGWIFSSSMELEDDLIQLSVGVNVQIQESMDSKNSVLFCSLEIELSLYVHHRLVLEWFHPQLRPHICIRWCVLKRHLFVGKWNHMIEFRWSFPMASMVPYDCSRKLSIETTFVLVHRAVRLLTPLKATLLSCNLDGPCIVLLPDPEPKLQITPLLVGGISPCQEDSESCDVVPDVLLSYMFQSNFSSSAEHVTALLKVQRKMIRLDDTSRWEENLWYKNDYNIRELIETINWCNMVLKFCSNYHYTHALVTFRNASVFLYPSMSQLPLLMSVTRNGDDGFLQERRVQNQGLLVTSQMCGSLWLHMGSVLVLPRHDPKALLSPSSDVLIFGAQISHHQHVLVSFYGDTFTLPKQKCELSVYSMDSLSLVGLSRTFYCSASFTVDMQGFQCVAGYFRKKNGFLIAFVFNTKAFWWRLRDVCVLQLRFNYTLQTFVCLSDLACGESKLFWPHYHFRPHSAPSLLSSPCNQLRLLVRLVSEDTDSYQDTQYTQIMKWYLPHSRQACLFRHLCVNIILRIFQHKVLLVISQENNFSMEWDLIVSIVVIRSVLSSGFIHLGLKKTRSSTYLVSASNRVLKPNCYTVSSPSSSEMFKTDFRSVSSTECFQYQRDGIEDVIHHELENMLPYMMVGDILCWGATWGHAEFLNVHTSNNQILGFRLYYVIVVTWFVSPCLRGNMTSFNGQTVDLFGYLQLSECHDKENIWASTVPFQNKEVANVQGHKVLFAHGALTWFVVTNDRMPRLLTSTVSTLANVTVTGHASKMLKPPKIRKQKNVEKNYGRCISRYHDSFCIQHDVPDSEANLFLPGET